MAGGDTKFQGIYDIGYENGEETVVGSNVGDNAGYLVGVQTLVCLCIQYEIQTQIWIYSDF